MSPKDWFDVIAQIIFAILGCMVFLQIRIAKDDLKAAKNDLRTRCKRESCAASVELSKRFAEKIIPAISKFYRKVKNDNYELKPLPLNDFYEEEINSLGFPAKELYDEGITFFKDRKELRSECIDILNSIEALAMNFTKRVADEDTAFTALAQVYCHFIERAFPVLCLLRDNKKSPFYENTLELYRLWSGKMKKNGMELQRMSIELQIQKQLEELNSIDGEINSISKKEFTPIGV